MIRFFSFIALVVALLAGGCGTKGRRTVDPATKALIGRTEEALDRGDDRTALALADSVTARIPEYPDGYFLRGRAHFTAERYQEAKAAFRRALEIDADYPGAWHYLGNSAFRRQEYRTALDAYERALETSEDRAGLWYNVGRSYARLHVADSAGMAYRKALALDPAHADAHAWYARLLEEEGRFEEALAEWERALELAPGTVENRYNVGALLLRTGRTEEAVEQLETVLEVDPRHEGALYSLAQALIRLDRPQEAERHLARLDDVRQEKETIQELQRQAQVHRDDPERWLALADALRDAGFYDAAINAHEVAVGLVPQHLPLRNNLANLYLAAGDTAEAMHHYQAILRADSTLADVWLNVGVVYANTGRRALARRAWNAALRHDPDHPEASAYLRRLAEMP